MSGAGGQLKTMRLLPFTGAVGGNDYLLVSVVLLVDNQELLQRDLQKQVRQDTRKYAGVRGACHSVSHSVVAVS